ncbi:alpha/beta hydrolase [Nocardioides sp.]|uniref:alpha/beta hydrolase n=1 Tax=Nocardioides sp. TaxID=35761 RepID=UPI0025EFDFF1|nr:alpha/beta hydrolase [Nocardioides sp.]
MTGDRGVGPDLEVVGGAHGVRADLADMDATGAQLASLGLDVGEVAASCHPVLVDGDVVASVVLAPVTFGRFEAELLGALDGPRGLSANAVRLSGVGLHMRATAAAYRAVDDALEWRDHLTDQLQGYLAGWALVTPVVGVPLAGAVTVELWSEGFFDDPEAWLTAHPDDLEELVASAPGFLDFYLPGVGYPATSEQGAALLALLYDQELTDVVLEDTATEPAPADLSDAMQRLTDLASRPDGFQIERVGEPPHEVWNVYLPGTKAFDGPLPHGGPLPDALEDSGLVQNLGTNFALVAGQDNAYVEAVVRALREAGVPPDAPIALYGHSQGGIVAARVAQALTDPGSATPYHVTNVVTAGSPVDHIDLPPSVQVLSLVNEHDIVPRLDGEPYDDVANHTTIITNHDTGQVTGNHSMDSTYLPMVAEIEASDDPAVRDVLAPLQSFQPGGSATTWTFQMQR